MKAKRELKAICRRKNEVELIREIKGAGDDRSSKTFWEVVKKRRRRKR